MLPVITDTSFCWSAIVHYNKVNGSASRHCTKYENGRNHVLRDGILHKTADFTGTKYTIAAYDVLRAERMKPDRHKDCHVAALLAMTWDTMQLFLIGIIHTFAKNCWEPVITASISATWVLWQNWTYFHKTLKTKRIRYSPLEQGLKHAIALKFENIATAEIRYSPL